jgi:phospholipase C
VARQPDKALEDDPTGRVAATLASGLAQHLEVAPPSEHEAIKSRVNALRTHKEALDYLKEVYVLVKAAKQRAAVRGNAGVRVSPLSHELVAEAVPHRRVTRQGPA